MYSQDPNPNPPGDRRIEQYLDRLADRLPRQLSAARRTELRAELAGHLAELVEAHRELGHSDPVDAALRQFGSHNDLAQEWQHAAAARPSAARLIVAGALFVSLLAFFGGMVMLGAGDAMGLTELGAALTGPILPMLIGITWALRDQHGRREYGPLAILAVAGFAAGWLSAIGLATPGRGMEPAHAGIAVLLLWLIVGSAMAGLTTVAANWQRGHQPTAA